MKDRFTLAMLNAYYRPQADVDPIEPKAAIHLPGRLASALQKYAAGLPKTGLDLQSPGPIALAAVHVNEVSPPPRRLAFLNLVRGGG